MAMQWQRRRRRRRRGLGTQVLEEELIVIGVGGVEQRDRVAIPQQLTVAVANQNAVDIRTVGAEVVQIDALVFVRAADLAVLVTARTAGKWRVQDGGGGEQPHAGVRIIGGVGSCLRVYMVGGTPDPCICADLSSAFEEALSKRGDLLPQA